MLACTGAAILWHVFVVSSNVPFLYLELADLPLRASKVHLLHGIWTVAALGLITTRFTRECTFVALVVYLLDASAGLHNAGAHIAQLTLFYALLLDEKLMRGEQRSGVRVFLHNVGVAAITVQLIIVYLNTLIWKLTGPNNLWLDGTVLFYVVNLQGFSLTWARPLLSIPLVTYTVTYLTLAYQLSFVPLLFTRWHGLSVVAGVGFHVGIALALGLVPFGLIMTGLVLLTVKDEGYRAAKKRLAAFVTVKPTRQAVKTSKP